MKRLISIAILTILAGAIATVAQPKFEELCPTLKESYCVQNKKTIEAAWVIAVGTELGKDEWIGMTKSMIQMNNLQAEEFKAGLKLSYVTKYTVKYMGIFSPGTGYKAVYNAFKEVYGRDPLVDQLKAWESKIKDGTAWYTTIVLAEQKRLNGDQTLRDAMANQAMTNVIGKSGQKAKYAKWVPGTSDYRQTVGQMRGWLYSQEAAADLRDVCRRVLNIAHVAKTGQSYTPSETEIDKMVKTATASKLIYRELVDLVGLSQSKS